MSTARFTLTFGGLSHEEALALLDEIDTDPRIEPLALIINETDESAGLWETTAYFETREACQQLAAYHPGRKAQESEIPQVDWVKQSLEGLAPVTAGRFFLHGSHDRTQRRSGGVSLEIDAGTAFGTGHHGTTSGCLLALDGLLKHQRPARVFDLGCGTGILAIAASRAAPCATLATDIDPEAVRVSRLNARRNAVSPAPEFRTAPGLHHPIIAARAPYDIVFANVLARPLLAMAQGLSRIVASQGYLVLSGVTLDQVRWVTARYLCTGLVKERTIRIGNWAAIILRNPKRKCLGQRHPRRVLPSQGPGWEDA